MRCAVGISGCRNAGQDRGSNLPVLFFLHEHFVGHDLHLEIGAADVLNGVDLAHAKLDRLPSKVIDADDEHRSPVGLKLASRRPDQHKRVLLARNERRLAVSHQGLLLRIRGLERNRFGSDATAQCRAKRGRKNNTHEIPPGTRRYPSATSRREQ